MLANMFLALLKIETIPLFLRTGDFCARHESQSIRIKISPVMHYGLSGFD